MSATATRMTVDEFLQVPEREDVRIELIDGEVIEMGRGGPMHEIVKANFAIELGAYFKQNRPGRVFAETMFRLTGTDSPIPDLSIVLSGELDPGHTGKTTVVPEIAIEVVSSEPAASLRKKIKLYHARGVQLVWVAYPELRIIEVHSSKEGTRHLDHSDILDAPDLLPGFAVSVAELLRA